MKHVASAALAVSALGLLAFGAGSAHAQDNWPNWTGAYAGINGGYSWDQDKTSITSPQLPGYGFTSTLRPSGGFGGGQLGYNWQMHNFVFGLETDFQYRDDKQSFYDGTITAENEWFGTVRPRIGYALPTLPALVYGTGGLAYGDVKDRIESFPGVYGSRETTRIGWTAGAGVEYAVGRWSVGLEYLHLDLGHDTVSSPLVPTVVPAYNARFTDTSDAVRLKINFRFWAPHAPVVEAPPPPPPAPMPAAAPAPAPAPTARTFIVFFDFDKYNLTPDARKVVEEAANAYKAGGSAKVTLAGYTDLSGSQAYNLRLSERRAKTVAAYMSKQGVPASAMDVSWHGKENPRVPTPDGVREPQNRRVEIGE